MKPNSSAFPSLLGILLMTLPHLSILASDNQSDGGILLTDFTENSTDFMWYVVNDNVMGGRSAGEFELGDGRLVFTGSTNTNGGGFSSIRTGPLRLDLSSQTGVRLSIYGDGRRYTWRLTTSATWRGRPISYWADFNTRDGIWSEAEIPFNSFIPRFRGQRLNGPALDPAQITGMGLMIYDQQDGPFELSLRNISAYNTADDI